MGAVYSCCDSPALIRCCGGGQSISDGNCQLVAKQAQAVLYARVSSKEQEREGYSIPAQVKLLRSYAERHDYEIVARFIDVETAKQSGRTNFTKMTAFLKEHPDMADEIEVKVKEFLGIGAALPGKVTVEENGQEDGDENAAMTGIETLFLIASARWARQPSPIAMGGALI